MNATGLYRGRLWHRRESPAHEFDRDMLLARVDVDAVDAAPKGGLQLVRGWPISLRAKDHLPDPKSPGRSLAERARSLVESVTGSAPRGRLQLISQPRAFGLTFNPVSFIYCLDGDRIQTVIAEVTNTPWGERHAYVLSAGETLADGQICFESPKALHVSPFFEMDLQYSFAFEPPGKRLRLSITNHREDLPVFTAGLALDRIASIGESMSPKVFRHAWMPGETLIGIYYQAALLAWKRTPFHPHPSKLPAKLAPATPAQTKVPR